MAQLRFRTPLLVLVLLFAVSCCTVQACNVPAFRYALERWPADLYQVVVYYEKLPPAEELGLLKKSAGNLANFALTTVDVATSGGKAIAEQRKINAYPWVEISYPVHSDIQGIVWSAPLAPGSARKIVESSSRSEVARRLLSGDVAVWVFVRSGNEHKDRRALDSVRSSLERASATLRIPEIGTDQNGDPIAVDDFKTYPVHFGLIELRRDHPGEAILLGALLKSEPDLEQYDEPIAFPVFGRGRALYALVGNGIQEKTILEACQSLMNWCSCEIKAANPGTDLLISANWSRPYGGKMVEDPDVPLVGLSGFVKSGGQATATKPSTAACPVVPAAVKAARVLTNVNSHGTLRRNLLWLAGAGGLVLVALSVLITMKKKR